MEARRNARHFPIAPAGQIVRSVRSNEVSGWWAGVLSVREPGGMTDAEIASTFGITAGEVGVALHKANAKLQELLAAEVLTRLLTAAACIVD
jgi:hypothetical protein